MIFVFLGVMLLIFAMFGYTLARYAKVWKRAGHKRFVYWIVQIPLTLITFFTVFGFRDIPGKVLPMIAIFISAVQFCFLVYAGVFMILRDLVCLILKKCKKGDSRFVQVVKGAKCHLVVYILTLVLGVAGFVNMGIVRETDRTVALAKTSVNDSLTFAVATDLHVGIGLLASSLDSYADKINAMDVDAVLFVGDLIDDNTSEENLELLSEAVSKIKSRYGTYFAFGNHDKNGSELGLKYYLEKAGVHVLLDEAVTIADDVYIVGRKDYTMNPIDMSEYDIDRDRPIIVMNHQPNRLASIAAGGADISLSGHTHGYQYPLARIFVDPTNDNVYGVKKYGDMTAITTSGSGGWGFHYKLPSPSEILKLTVTFNN